MVNDILIKIDVFFKDGVWLHGRGETNDTRVNQSLIEMNTRTLQRSLKNEDISWGGTEKQNDNYIWNPFNNVFN